MAKLVLTKFRDIGQTASDESITEILLDLNYIPVEYRSYTQGERSCYDDYYLSSLWREWESSEKISDWIKEADWINLYNGGFWPMTNKEAIDFLKDKKVI